MGSEYVNQEYDTDLDTDPNAFIALWSLHFDRGVSIGTLAAVIETGGICGEDRYGRWVLFKPGSPEVTKVLDRLAVQWSYYQPDASEDARRPRDAQGDILAEHGWRRADLPDLGAVEAAAPAVTRRPSDARKTEETLLRTIGALLEVISGANVWHRHTDYESSDAFIQRIAEKFSGIRGLSARNLQTNFALARKLLE